VSEQQSSERPLRVAIVGAGPAGIYAADVLMKSGTDVSIDLYERQPAPFGLIRYGVAPDHPRIKGIVKALHQVLSKPQVRLLGNVEYGVDVKLDELRRYYDAVVFTTGAEKDRDLDVPGVDLPGSFGGAEFVSWFDGHPDVPREWPLEAESIAVVGAGNVGLDVARMLSKTADELLVTEIPDNVYDGLKASPVREVHVFARRGPAQAKFTPLELRELDHSPNVEVLVNPEDIEYDDGSSPPSTPTTRPSSSCASSRSTRCAPPTRARASGPASCGCTSSSRRSRSSATARSRPSAPSAPSSTARQRQGHRRAPRLAGAGGLPLRRLPLHRAARPALGQPQPRRAARRRARARPRRQPAARRLRQRLGQARPGRLIGHTKGDAIETVGSMLEDLETLPRAEQPEPAAVLEFLESRGVQWTTWDGWQLLDAHEQALGEAYGLVGEQARDRVKVVDRQTMIDVSRAVAAVQAEEPGAQEQLDEALERADEQIDAALESRSA
jgi:ferredoxin--NADP+ reductase